MSRQLLICLVFYLIVSLGAAKGKEKNLKFYPASTILPSLKENAYAIFRCYEHEFELIDYGRATEKVHVVITILSHNGDKYSELYLPYDNSRIIKSITGQTYNEAGFPVKKIKNSDVDDVNYNSAGTLFDEIRIKRCKLTSDSYPYTIEYVYEIEHKGLISYPEWTPVDDYRFSVEHSSF